MLDFEQYSFTQPAVLITIITEAVLKDSIVALLRNLKVMGYTVSRVEGEGRRLRPVEPSGEEEVAIAVETGVTTNVEIKAVVSQDLSNVILYALKEHQNNFAIVAYRQAVEALVE